MNYTLCGKEPVELTLSENGFYGYFYEGGKNREKAIINMSGSDGSKEFAISSAEVLVKDGYSVLVLGIIKWEGLPQVNAEIPVDYAERAAKWLLSQNYIKKVGIRGASLGGQYSLLAASLIPEISLVAAASPYDYVLECVDDKFKRTGKSTFSYKGKPVECSPAVLLDKSVPLLILSCAFSRHYGLKRMLRFYYEKNPVTENGRIRVENMKADVLLIAAQNDDCWPAEYAAERVSERLEKCGYPYRVKKVIYEKASHAVGGGIDNSETSEKILKMLPAEKKYPKECAEARADSVQQILEFLKEW